MIKYHLVEVNRNVIKCKDTVKAPSYSYLGPHPVEELLGMGLDVDMLMQSQDLGRLRSFAEFDTFRISQSTFYTVCQTSIEGVIEVAYFGDNHRINTSLIKCNTQTIWFERFVRWLNLRF